MGETGFCKNLRFPAVSCENLRFPAGLLRKSAIPKSLDLQSEPKISENLRKCAFRVRFIPFAVSLLARPDLQLSFFDPNFSELHRGGPQDIARRPRRLGVPGVHGVGGVPGIPGVPDVPDIPGVPGVWRPWRPGPPAVQSPNFFEEIFGSRLDLSYLELEFLTYSWSFFFHLKHMCMST